MKSLSIICSLVGVGACVVIGCGGSEGSGPSGNGGGGAGPFARITDLGDVNAVNQRQITDNGVMVGGLVSNGFTQATPDTWAVGGQPIHLPETGQNGFAIATASSDNGVIVGAGGSACGGHPLVWQGGSLSPLKTTPSVPMPQAVNDNGQIVGFDGGPCGANVRYLSGEEGLYWSSPSATPVRFSPAGFLPLSMNDSGETVGVVVEAVDKVEYFEANVSASTTATDLGFSGANPINEPAGAAVVNDAGTIALASGANNELVLISKTGAKTQTGSGAIPSAINSQGDVVGSTPQNRAFIYTAAKGVVDLNTYLKPGTGFTLTLAFSINSHGQVLAFGTAADNATHDLLLQLPSGTF